MKLIDLARLQELRTSREVGEVVCLIEADRFRPELTELEVVSGYDETGVVSSMEALIDVHEMALRARILSDFQDIRAFTCGMCFGELGLALSKIRLEFALRL